MDTETPLMMNYRKSAWATWLVLALVITAIIVYSILAQQERSVTSAYCSAVENWFAGKPLYSLQGHGFLYLPQAALVFVPWAMLPHMASEIIWRLTMIVVVATSVFRMTRMLGGDSRWFFVTSLASALMAAGCARNGQSTLMITGLMIFAAVDLCEQRWWRATALLAVAFAFKPFAIVMMLLAAAVYPQMSWRLAIGLIIVAIAPFATQRPEYVISQFRDCFESLRITFQVGEATPWAQFFGMLQVAGLDIPESLRTPIRLVAAVATLAACWLASRHLPRQRTAFYLFSFSACYLMLFNSRTEGNTYAMVGPVYGALLAEAAFQLHRGRSTVLLVFAIIFSVLSFEIAVLVTARKNAVWISPLVCVCVSGYLVYRLIEELTMKDDSVAGFA